MQLELIGFYSRDGMCLLRGADWPDTEEGVTVAVRNVRDRSFAR